MAQKKGRTPSGGAPVLLLERSSRGQGQEQGRPRAPTPGALRSYPKWRPFPTLPGGLVRPRHPPAKGRCRRAGWAGGRAPTNHSGLHTAAVTSIQTSFLSSQPGLQLAVPVPHLLPGTPAGLPSQVPLTKEQSPSRAGLETWRTENNGTRRAAHQTWPEPMPNSGSESWRYSEGWHGRNEHPASAGHLCSCTPSSRLFGSNVLSQWHCRSRDPAMDRPRPANTIHTTTTHLSLSRGHQEYSHDHQLRGQHQGSRPQLRA